LLGDGILGGGNYAISLMVVGMALRYRAMTAFVKGATMGAPSDYGEARHGVREGGSEPPLSACS
jgi:hypothetical protein